MTFKLEVGTLADIGAQVGDVVELMEPDTFRGEGALYEIKSGPSGIRYAQHKDGGTVNCGATWTFRIVSRAQSSPVITETVKRIVPGVYGKVVVDHEVGIRMDTSTSRDELTAAIETLTQIRDAMKEGQK